MNPVRSWQPNIDNLTQCVRLLQALRDPTRSDHVSALRSLEENVLQSNFVLYILHVFAEGYAYESSGLTIDLRQLAGLIIKNYVFPHLTQMAEEVQFLMKKELIQALHDPVPDIRNTSAILVGKISESFPINLWVSMLPPILEYLDLRYLEVKPSSVDGCLLAVKRICEDSSLKLSQDDTTRPLEILVPKLLDLMTAAEASVRARALESYNCLLYLLETPASIAVGGLRSRNTSFDSVGGNGGDGSRHSRSPPLLSSPTGAASSSVSMFSSAAATSPLIIHMHVFISSLAQLSRDSVPLIRKLIVQGISIIACLHVALLEPFFANICEFMLASILDRGQLLDGKNNSNEKEEDEGVALEACEFWHALLQSPDTQRAMAPYLPRLIEHLIARLVLTREQMEAERQDAEEENSGAKALKIHPVHSQLRGGGGGGENSSSSRNGVGGSKQQEMKENAELSSRWTLRKQCALSLDTMAMHFPPEEVLRLALPKIQQSLASSHSVFVQESGWLALGALSQGCLGSMGPYLPQLMPLLLVMARDERLPEMKSICCWVISRLSPLFAAAASEGQGIAVQWYVQSLVALCERIVTENEHVKVVEAGCSALCLLIDNAFPMAQDDDEDGSTVLSEHVSMILGAINHALDKCGQKTSLLVVDIIGMLADTIKTELARPEYTSMYLPKLMDKFMSLDDDDSRVFPLLETLTSVLAVIGLEAREYVSYVYERCLRIAQTVLVALSQRSPQRHNQSLLQQVTDLDLEDQHEADELVKAKDFAVCAMDVLSALSEGLEQHFLELARPSREVLLQVTFLALHDSMPELRQSAFSLTGELCKFCFSALFTPELAKNLLELCVHNLDAQLAPFVCNNAAWTIGELALLVGGDFMRPFIGRVMSNLIVALQTVDYQDAFKVNIAVTIGRLGLVNTIEVADMADEFFAAWCR